MTRKRAMSRETRRHTHGEIGKVRVIEDFLPRPSELVLRDGREG
jgi:hypothetical protein